MKKAQIKKAKLATLCSIKREKKDGIRRLMQ